MIPYNFLLYLCALWSKVQLCIQEIHDGFNTKSILMNYQHELYEDIQLHFWFFWKVLVWIILDLFGNKCNRTSNDHKKNKQNSVKNWGWGWFLSRPASSGQIYLQVFESRPIKSKQKSLNWPKEETIRDTGGKPFLTWSTPELYITECSHDQAMFTWPGWSDLI